MQRELTDAAMRFISDFLKPIKDRVDFCEKAAVSLAEKAKQANKDGDFCWEYIYEKHYESAKNDARRAYKDFEEEYFVLCDIYTKNTFHKTYNNGYRSVFDDFVEP